MTDLLTEIKRLRAAAAGEQHGPRPDGCCGKCPPILGGGYDCTCEGNPLAGRPKETTSSPWKEIDHG